MEQESMFTVMNYLATKGRGAGGKPRGQTGRIRRIRRIRPVDIGCGCENYSPVLLWLRTLQNYRPFPRKIPHSQKITMIPEKDRGRGKEKGVRAVVFPPINSNFLIPAYSVLFNSAVSCRH